MSQDFCFDFEHRTDCAIEMGGGTILRLTHAARAWFPELAVGRPVPDFLAGALNGPEETGSLVHGGTVYLFSRAAGEKRCLLVLCPAPQTGLTDGQLDGFVRQMRGLLQTALVDLSALASGEEANPDAFSKRFFQMYRLLSNLDFLRGAGSPEGVPFRPVTMDLAGLCRQLTEVSDSLLRETKGRLRLNTRLDTLLISGDPALLERMLLALLSNAAKAAPADVLTLSLFQRGQRAVLTLGGGEPPEECRLNAIFSGSEGDGRVPVPGEGAGMGLPIARHIAALHGGTLLLESREAGLYAIVSLPIGPLDPHMPLHSPRPEADGGLSPVVVELADVLPPAVFLRELED